MGYSPLWSHKLRINTRTMWLRHYAERAFDWGLGFEFARHVARGHFPDEMVEDVLRRDPTREHAIARIRRDVADERKRLRDQAVDRFRRRREANKWPAR